MLNAFRHLLCSLLCQYNQQVTIHDFKEAAYLYGIETNFDDLASLYGPSQAFNADL